GQRVPPVQGGGAAHDEAAVGEHREPDQRRRRAGERGADGVVDGQGGADRVHQVAGGGAGEPEHPGQRREPGVDRDGYDEGPAGGGEEGDGRGGVVGAGGDGAGGGGGDRVPGVGPRWVHH